MRRARRLLLRGPSALVSVGAQCARCDVCRADAKGRPSRLLPRPFLLPGYSSRWPIPPISLVPPPVAPPGSSSPAPTCPPLPWLLPLPLLQPRFPLAASPSSVPPVRVLLRFSEPPPRALLLLGPCRVSPPPPHFSLHDFPSFAFPSPCPLALPPSPLLSLPVPPSSSLPSSSLPSPPFARPSPLSLPFFRLSLQAGSLLPPLLLSLVSECCLDAPGAHSSGSRRGAHWPWGAMSGTNIA